MGLRTSMQGHIWTERTSKVSRQLVLNTEAGSHVESAGGQPSHRTKYSVPRLLTRCAGSELIVCGLFLDFKEESTPLQQFSPFRKSLLECRRIYSRLCGLSRVHNPRIVCKSLPKPSLPSQRLYRYVPYDLFHHWQMYTPYMYYSSTRIPMPYTCHS